MSDRLRSLVLRSITASIALAAAAGAQTPLSGALTGTLAAGVYTAAANISVPAGQTLTLSPGVIVKFVGARQFVVDGTLVSNGTAGSPVIFTDDADDSAGGDTNGNGPSVGSPGAWYNIVFRSGAGASTLNYTEVRFAGASNFAAVDLQSADITLTNSTVRDCSARALWLRSNSWPTVDNCAMLDNGGYAFDAVPISAVPGFTGNTATGNQIDALRISTGAVTGNLTLGLASMVDGAFLVGTNITVSPGATLTLPAGAVIKWNGARQLLVRGTLDCQGTAGNPVVLTDDHDDSVGGDTLKDGVTAGAPGAWYNVVFDAQQTGSTLHHTEVRFAGASNFNGFDIQNTAPTFVNCVVRNCNSGAFYLRSNSAPSITGCVAQDNGGRAFDAVPLYAVPGIVNNTATGNGLDVMRITTATLTSNLTLEPASMVGGAFHFATNLTVGAGVTLTLKPGVICKWIGARQLLVNGTLRSEGTAAAPVILTDDDDDTAAGDTNKNGASSGAVGAWYNVVFSSSQAASELDFTEVRYAGASNFPGVACQSTDPVLRDCTVRDCNRDGIGFTGAAYATVHDCHLIDNGGTGIAGLRLDAVPGLVNNSCAGNGIDCVRITSATVTTNVRIGTHSMPAGAFLLSANLDVRPTGELTVEQGVVFKLVGARQVLLQGRSRLLGTAFEPVVFTDDADDSVAGDSNGDGPSTGSPGAFYNLHLPDTGELRRIENVVVRFAGASNFPAVNADGAAIFLRSVRVDDAVARGFELRDLAPPQTNLVAWSCGGDGVYCTAGDFNIVHATVADCGGDGIEAAAAWTGLVMNSNVWNSAGNNFAGLAAGRVLRSNGGLVGSGGNIDLDPQFVDPQNGDLRLGAGSPCLGAADLGTAQFVARDFDENSRILDHALGGVAAPDMGAFERGNWDMEVANTPRPGETVFLTVQGQPGTSFLGFGLNEASVLVQPYGVLLTGSLTTTALAFTFPIPVGQPIPLTVPNDPTIAGMAIGLQTLNFPLGNLAVGNFGPRYRALVRP